MEIICTINNYEENNNYFINFKNEELIFSLLTDEFMEVINIMFDINNDLTIQGLNELTNKGKKFREEILNKPQYYNIINSDLFIYIYQWFTALPLYHLDEVIGDKNGERRNKLCSKNLIVMNGKKQVKVTNRNGGRHLPYLIFKKYLKQYYNTGEMTFVDLINNGVPIIKNGNGEKKSKDEIINYLLNDENNIVNKNSLKDLNNLKIMPYNEYLQTKHWKKVRTKILDKIHKCQLCSSKYNLQIHHNTYDNLGEERYEDLIVLCEICHARHHGKI